MTLRSDHVAGAAFAGFGLLILAVSGELPIGRTSMPGAGFLPHLVAWLLVALGVILFLRARESAPFSEIGWDDLVHAASVVVVSGLAIALYARLGFLLTMFLMLLSLLLLVERRNIFRAGLYSVVIVVLAFGLFARVLKAPLPTGPFGF